MSRDSCNKCCCNKDITGSHTEPNVSIAAQSGSHITAPVLTNNTITGNVHIIHNAPGFTEYHTHSETIQISEISSAIHKYKKLICSEYQYVTEYNSLPGEHVLLSERYTQPLILQRHRGQKEREEEICSSGERFQQVLSSRSSDDSVHLNSLFDPDSHGISPSAVILQGNSGNGKSFTVQKIMMDWASGDLYKGRFDIVFHLKCKEINCISGKKSLVEILSYSCSLSSDQISQVLQHSPEKVLFIIDGFDELRLTQDIYHMSPNTDPLQKAPAEVILCDLLRGRILPESFLLVTSRSTATDTLSKLLKGPQRFSEIMGFSEKGVEEYFQKFFQNRELSRKANEFVRANETLMTACSIPVICWIICTVMRERFSDGADAISGLETTTSIYVDFVLTLLKHHCQGLSPSFLTLLRSLGQLAERGLLEKQVLFDEETVNETVADPAGSPFLCKFLLKKRTDQETMFSFMHLSFQEFFTALYYISQDSKMLKGKLSSTYHGSSNAAVMHFLFGLLNEDVRRTLEGKHVSIHPDTESSLKEFLRSTEAKVNSLLILHCLYEFHEESFVKEVLNAKGKISVSFTPLRRTDCMALLYCCQCCQSMEELTIDSCQFTSEILCMIIPVLHKFKSVSLLLKYQPDSALVDLLHAVTRGRTQSSQSVDIEIFGFGLTAHLYLSISEELGKEKNRIVIALMKKVLQSFHLFFPQSTNLTNIIDWTKLFRALQADNKDELLFFFTCLSGLKKMELRVNGLSESWANYALSLSKNIPSLTELCINSGSILEEGIGVLQKSHIRPDCALTVKGFTDFNHTMINGICHFRREHVWIYLNAGGFSRETVGISTLMDLDSALFCYDYKCRDLQ